MFALKTLNAGKNGEMSKLVKAYKYDGQLYSDEDRVQCLPLYTLYRKLEDEEKITTVLDYGRPDYLAEYYYILDDYQREVVDYQIEDLTEFLDKFADRLGIEVLKIAKRMRRRRQKNET